jgi:hypothetical protein
MGNRLLHQSHSPRRSCKVFARGQRRRTCDSHHGLNQPQYLGGEHFSAALRVLHGAALQSVCARTGVCESRWEQSPRLLARSGARIWPTAQTTGPKRESGREPKNERAVPHTDSSALHEGFWVEQRAALKGSYCNDSITMSAPSARVDWVIAKPTKAREERSRIW